MGGWIIFGIVASIVMIPISYLIVKINDQIREEKFTSTLEDLKRQGYKVRYANQGTGTISYSDKYGNYTSISVYRGYNSHCK